MRKALSKSVRFEVFKRDKFTCHYCGGKAPDVVLHVDHIHPVSKGGTNEIMNLLTSCFNCNMGKGAKPLSDSSAIEKQRKQLELMQERREQIELMFEWKKSLGKLENQTAARVMKYVKAKIKPYALNDEDQATIHNLIDRYEIDAILSAVDISAKQYLKSKNGEIEQWRIDEFINKLGGILHNTSLNPVDRKLAYIKNVLKSNVRYYDAKLASIILRNYVKALRVHWRYTDEQILSDLDSEVLLKTQEIDNWSEWRKIIDGWIESIKKDDKGSGVINGRQPVKCSLETLEGFMVGRKFDYEGSIQALCHILSPFKSFDEERFKKDIRKSLINFIEENQLFAEETIKKYDENEEERKEFAWEAISEDWSFYTQYEPDKENDGGWYLSKIDNAGALIVEGLFENFYFSHLVLLPEDVKTLQDLSLEFLKSLSD
jgi:hypothetical protein